MYPSLSPKARRFLAMASGRSNTAPSIYNQIENVSVNERDKKEPILKLTVALTRQRKQESGLTLLSLSNLIFPTLSAASGMASPSVIMTCLGEALVTLGEENEELCVHTKRRVMKP